MSRNLYIIVRSLNPNSYLNSILHCVLNKDVHKVIFVAVKKQGEVQIPLSKIAASISSLLDNLSEGRYTYHERATNKIESIDLSKEYKTDIFNSIVDKYKKCHSILGEEIRDNIKPIQYDELKEQLSIIRRTEDAMFDITAASNYLVSDISAISMAEGISSLYTFESFVEPQYAKDGWKTLIHQLDIDFTTNKPTYQYVNLLSTSIYRECVRSIFGKMSAQIGLEIKELNDDLIEAHKKRLKLLEIRAAMEGADTPPQVKIEIEDIHGIIKELRNQT